MSSSRHVMVDSVCEWCRKVYQVRRIKVVAGLARFCSKNCFHEYQRELAKNLYGYEKGTSYFDSGKWVVRWYDDLGKIHVTSYQKWWWEINVGEIPKGLEVYLIDGNAENISPDNFALGTHSDVGLLHANKQLGRKHTIETKNKMRRTKRVGNFSDGILDEKRYNEYPDEFSDTIKKKVRERDHYCCRICHNKIESINGRVHHIDADRFHNTMDNLIYFCKKCHGKVHSSGKTNDPVILAFRSMLYT